MTSPVPIAVAVVEHDDHFLVGQRPDGVPLAGLWEFPGGKVKSGERPEQAVQRECLEETGLDVDVIAPYPEQVQRYDHGCVRLHFFACRPRNPQTTPREPWRWVTRKALAHLEFPVGNRGLLQFLANLESK